MMAKKLAVLVGCNYPGTKQELHGCINDVKRIPKSLLDRFGFHESDITVLINADLCFTVQCKGANIKRALNRLMSDAQPNDVLFFHFSGHGIRLPLENGKVDDTATMMNVSSL